jgi:hypothetical protein
MKEIFFWGSRDAREVIYTTPDERMQARMCREKR